MTIAGLQAYTINLYSEIEKESGINVGLKKTGGFSLAGTAERFESLKTEWAHFKSIGHETHLVTPAEVLKRCPIVDVSNIIGALYDPSEGRCEAHGSKSVLSFSDVCFDKLSVSFMYVLF